MVAVSPVLAPALSLSRFAGAVVGSAELSNGDESSQMVFHGGFHFLQRGERLGFGDTPNRRQLRYRGQQPRSRLALSLRPIDRLVVSEYLEAGCAEERLVIGDLGRTIRRLRAEVPRGEDEAAPWSQRPCDLAHRRGLVSRIECIEERQNRSQAFLAGRGTGPAGEWIVSWRTAAASVSRSDGRARSLACTACVRSTR